MSATISGSQGGLGQVYGHHHHHRANTGSGSAIDPLAATGTTTGSTPAAEAVAPPSAGLQKFASELQSILLNAQSGQATASGTTAGSPATAADPAGATDPTAPQGQAGPIRHLADRLQELLGGSSQTSNNSSSQSSLESVLNTLQQSLQQTLASYGSQVNATSTTSLTA